MDRKTLLDKGALKVICQFFLWYQYVALANLEKLGKVEIGGNVTIPFEYHDDQSKMEAAAFVFPACGHVYAFHTALQSK